MAKPKKAAKIVSSDEVGDGVQSSSKDAGTKAAKPTKQTKTAPSATASKGAKAEKSKKATDTAIDGVTIGSRVKAEVEKPEKTRKAKPADKDVVIGPSGDTAEVDNVPDASASKKKGNSGKSGKAKDESANVTKDKVAATKVAAETPKTSKSKKDKQPKKDEKKDPPKDGSKNAGVNAVSKEAKPKKEKAAAKAKPENAELPKSGSKEDEPLKNSKAKAATPKSSTKDGVPESEAKPKKSKKEPKKGPTPTKDSTVAPDLAMDQAPFESLLDSGKDKAPKSSKVAKTDGGPATKAVKQTKKDNDKPKKVAKPKEKTEKKDAPGKSKDNVKSISASADSAKAEQPKSKKRKAPAVADADAVKSDLLDPLTEHAAESAKKKQKKEPRKSLGESFGELVNSGLEVASQGANSLRESFGGLTGGTEKAITDSAPEVVSAPGKAKDDAKIAVKKAKGKGKAAVDAVASAADLAEGEDAASDSEPDDQTAALLKGFESSGDDEPTEGEGFREDAPVPALPNSKATKKQLKSIKPSPTTEAGVVYLGRIPHGFFEHQMRSYFTQFGPISRLRLSRSRKTGRSKHYAFIEFESEEVAKIVAGTMDNYLMFGHILKCKLVPKENQHEGLWKGANKRFKAVPFNKIEGRKLELPAGKSAWTARKEREEAKRASKLEQTKAIGYEFVSPVIKGVEEVQKKINDVVADMPTPFASTTTVEQEKSLVTAGDGEGKTAVVVSEEVKTKTKSSKKGKVAEASTTTTTTTTATAAVKKTKRKADHAGEMVEGAAKKAKKAVKQATA